ncbi:uncharacterized protein N7479_008002 [Penicillium vulpinum]|uniref:Uncharacterized protein n=1 Tax=Penicillium vulpinum TaxID=29845 RepID=A0A1V6RLS0_9EURO|nr:uncharacterized protein N7479_008002 [Penicillium vulpinum]KAJ5960852.1 hypothetical protein N7479_008002 [Penicillium vulpinum]OQE02755.1 hypothetical protein PENVUL_c039G08768 [Penicillium vulpinum]
MYYRTLPSRKKREGRKSDPRQLNPQISTLCPELIDVSVDSASSMIEKINSDYPCRHLPFQSTGDQIELLRLEASRLKMMGSTDSRSNPANETSAQRPTSVLSQALSSNGEPGPTVPNSMRTSMRPRTAVLSESQISVLDLGPSLHSTHLLARASRRNLTSGNTPNGTGLARTTAPNFMPGPGSDTSDRPLEHRLQTDELESVALTSASGSVNNEFPLRLRQRRQNRPNITLPNPQELRPNRVNRASTFSEPRGLRNRAGSDGSPTFFADESSRRIHSLSVPQSPRSPSLPPQPALLRSQSSFNGMDPAFSAMRNAERARRMARDAAGSRDADRN